MATPLPRALCRALPHAAQWQRRVSKHISAVLAKQEDAVAGLPAALDGVALICPLTPRSEALHRVEDIGTPDILTNARAMCHIASHEEAQWAKEFSDAVERYAQRDFDEALPLLRAALAKAAVADDKDILWLMIQDCQGPRDGVVQGKHK